MFLCYRFCNEDSCLKIDEQCQQLLVRKQLLVQRQTGIEIPGHVIKNQKILAQI